VIDQHLDPRDVVAYVDGVATAAERGRIEAHLATCAECRAEVSEVPRIIATAPRARTSRRRLIISAAGIAAMLLVFFWPHPDTDRPLPRHRESAITTTIAPVLIAPLGAVASASSFTWSAVPHASQYVVRVFDPDGSVVWQGRTRDTVLTPPPEIGLRVGRPYYWKIEAQTGFDRSTSSDLVEFSIRDQRRQ
jgi:anti-sigma factor RsiW